MTKTTTTTKTIRKTYEYNYGLGASSLHSYTEKITVTTTAIDYIADSTYSMKQILNSYNEYKNNCCNY